MITKLKVQKIRVRKWLDAVSGGLKSTNTLDKLGEPIATEILERALLWDKEEALLANYQGASDWCLLTTKRLIWLNEGVSGSLPWQDVVLAQLPPEEAAQVIRGERSKDDVADLEVFDSSGLKHIVRIEAGESYYIIWSAILAFSNYSRTPDPISIS